MRTSRLLQNYKGVVDPLKGDAMNERVRALAKEATEIIFSNDPPQIQSQTSTGVTILFLFSIQDS